MANQIQHCGNPGATPAVIASILVPEIIKYFMEVGESSGWQIADLWRYEYRIQGVQGEKVTLNAIIVPENVKMI